MKRKTVAFISPVWEWWPKTLYRDLVELLWENSSEYEYTLISSAKQWILLHFLWWKYDVIITSVPFLWKPLCSHYILNIHWLYRNDRGFRSPAALLNWLYPYNSLFAELILYPSLYLQNYCALKHKNQKVLHNISRIPFVPNSSKTLSHKKEITLLTIFRADIYEKALWIMDIYETLQLFHPEKKIRYRIAGFGKHYEEMKKKFDIGQLHKNISIEWIWKLDHNIVVEEIEKCDIFLYSTFYETFGIILLEVLALWKPIILNNYPSFSWIFDSLFISKDRQDFLSKLESLLYDEEYFLAYLEKVYNNREQFWKEKVLQQWYSCISQLSYK